MAKKQLIPAVAYLRKSTKGKKADGRQRQEKSIGQQKEEIIKLARGRFQILQWFTDDGVSGSKRGANRPDFHRMLNGVRELGAQALLCDDLSRFHRGRIDDVEEDTATLRKAGVRWIILATGDEHDLGERDDIGAKIRFLVAVWSNCEYVRNLSRKVSLAKRNGAERGERMGAVAPYGMKLVKHGLEPGDPAQVKTVRWIFDAFVNKSRSQNDIAADLNERKVKGPQTKSWSSVSVGYILKRRAYVGDFVYNEKHLGQWFGIDGKGEVVKNEQLDGDRKLFVKKAAWKGIVSRDLFDRAQNRLKARAGDRKRRKQKYALGGIVVCGHCGERMLSCFQDGCVKYKCSSNARFGKGSCGYWKVREDRLLPFLMEKLGEEVAGIERMLSTPPDKLRYPRKEAKEHRQRLEQDRDELAADLARAQRNLLLAKDDRTFRDLEGGVTELRDRLDAVESQLATEQPTGNGYTSAELEALGEWWTDFMRRAISVPVNKPLPTWAAFWRDAEFEEQRLLIEPRSINEALRDLGAEVRVWFKTVPHKTSGGKSTVRHQLVRGRFRLGNQSGKLPGLLKPSARCTSTTG